MNEPIIAVDEVGKHFRDGTRALDGLSLTIPRGVIYGLLGPNGAGKTTLIRILATLLRPDSGTARVAGFDVTRRPAAVRDRIGLAGQFSAVDEHLTGRENIAMIGRLYGLSRRDAAARTAQVVARVGLVEVADRQVKTYSGGMRRRVDLAACLVGRPQVPRRAERMVMPVHSPIVTGLAAYRPQLNECRPDLALGLTDPGLLVGANGSAGLGSLRLKWGYGRPDAEPRTHSGDVPPGQADTISQLANY
jgi:ABC-type transport system involved in cytochrome c biogenesis ATPase subunit